MRASKVRVFRGDETRQVTHDGRPAHPTSWYWEPADYVGDVLWSVAHLDRRDAVREALRSDDDAFSAAYQSAFSDDESSQNRVSQRGKR